MSTESALAATTSQARVATRKTISPYDLTSADNPGTLISKPLLRGPNYDEWATNLRLALKARKKFGFADGSIPQPVADDPDFEDWTANNALVVSWMKLTIHENLSTSMSHIDDSHELWIHIQKRFGVKNGQRVQRLKTELATCRQRGVTIETYYGRLSQLWRSLADYQQAKTMEDVRKEREEDKLHQFLMGLDDSVYGTVKSALLSRVPLPSLEEAYNALTQDEESKSLSRLNDERTDGVSFAVQTASRPRNVVDNRELSENRTCSHCGKIGHIAENCFKLVGYPPWLEEKLRNRNNGSSSRGGSSYNGSGRGSNKQSGGRGSAQTNIVTSSLPSAPLSSDDRIGLSGLNDAQWKILQQILDERKSTSPQTGTYFLESWIIDSGATNHMTGSLEFLRNVCDMPPILIKLPDGRFTTSTKQGRVHLGSSLDLQDVLFVDGLHCHLISVSQLTRTRQCLFQITDKICVIQDRTTQMLIGAGRELNGLYFFRGVETAAVVTSKVSPSTELWHRRLGHASSKALKLLPFSDIASSAFDSKTCEICIQAKQTRDPFPLSSNKTTFAFELVHCDLWGPYRTTSICGSRYFLTLVDDFSRAVWLYLLPSKQEAPLHLKNFIALVKRQYSTDIKTIRSDNGSEFICLSDFFAEKGIIHETSCVGTPQQNGRVEHKHRHILNVARALRFQAGLPIEFWSYCALTAAYLINRTPTPLLQGKTPFELIYHRPPPLNHVRVFGCVCYAHNQKHGGDKFASRSNKSIFLGYPFAKKGWRVYNIETGKISVSRDVVFSETEFHFSDLDFSSSSDFATPSITIDSSPPPLTILESSSPVSPTAPNTPTVAAAPPSSELVPDNDDTTDIDGSDNNDDSDDELMLSPTAPASPISPSSTSSSPATAPPVETERLGKGCRAKQPPVRLADYVTTILHQPFPSATPYPLDNYLSSSGFSDNYQAFLLAITSGHEPRSYNEAILDENWRDAVSDEIVSLEDLGTWTVEDLPPGKKALGCKWVFRLKYKSDGTLERHKARLVVLGNNQTEGLDYTETFAPVAKMVTVRAFLQQVVFLDWEVHQMDVHNAFLHGDLDEEVYMQFPPGFRNGDKSKVCRLRKSLYGLKQAPRCWFEKLSTALKEYGFTQDISDYSLFIFEKEGIRLHVLVYVDDLIITGTSVDVINEFKSYLSSCFYMKDLGILRYFLGIEVARSPEGIYLCQRKYAVDIINETGLLGVKPVSFPLEQNHKLHVASGDTIDDPLRYRRLVGRLIYLGTTRPELSYAIHILSQFMNEPKAAHWEAALRVVRYLKSSPGQGILLRANTPLELNAWCDSDFSTCPQTSRSLTGWFIQLGGSPLSWKTQKHGVVSRSSAEAEYRAMADTVSELLWLRELLPALGIPCTKPITLHSDSLSAICLAANPVYHARTKHVRRDVHFVRDEIANGTIVTKHVSTTSQLADILTKALGRKEFEEFLVKLGICNLHTPACGGVMG
ncbi:Reverse transcriptase RNA-dependent DNA polymerase [Arabidopsis suecica]|uniref:Reverse transcriptase RNA-dependent DNA polymerase n=1 Tax=Arabidopsis suecica TaxID=45249 RepID=A0A8T1Y3L8_ARASU|nr:Reverse transcriptase RNA-dependent DNA polymerase [Arabidopsis suecica]